MGKEFTKEVNEYFITLVVKQPDGQYHTERCFADAKSGKEAVKSVVSEFYKSGYSALLQDVRRL